MHLLCILLIGLGLFLLSRFFLARRRGGKPPQAHSTAERTETPESAARRILAERYARGDISTDDFHERASVLNWTPGTGT